MSGDYYRHVRPLMIYVFCCFHDYKKLAVYQTKHILVLYLAEGPILNKSMTEFASGS